MYYKLYGATENGWKFIKRIWFKYEIDDEIEKLDRNVYIRVLVMEHDVQLDQDSVVFEQDLEPVIKRKKKRRKI